MELFLVLVSGPYFLIELKQLDCSCQSALLEDILCSLRCHESHLIDNFFVHLNGEEVAHLAVCRHYVLQESHMTQHIFESIAVFEGVQDKAHPSLILAQDLNAAVLDPVVIDDKCADLHS